MTKIITNSSIIDKTINDKTVDELSINELVETNTILNDNQKNMDKQLKTAHNYYDVKNLLTILTSFATSDVGSNAKVMLVLPEGRNPMQKEFNIKEITLVWNISYQQRCLLLEKGITQWDDPLLISKIYPYQIKDNQRKMIQNKMITINSQHELKISPRKIKKKEFISILKNQENSIILDIESIIDLQEKETYFDDNSNAKEAEQKITNLTLNNKNLFKIENRGTNLFITLSYQILTP